MSDAPCVGDDTAAHQRSLRAERVNADVEAVEMRQKAIEVALAVTSGAYQTSLLTYFIQRDLFPAVMKVSPALLELGAAGKRADERSLYKTPSRRPKSRHHSRSSACWPTTTSLSFRTRTRCG